MIRLGEIEAKAKAATLGSWEPGPHYKHTIVALGPGGGEIGEMRWTPQGEANAAYVVSVDPVVGAAMVDALRKARAFLDKIVALEPAIADAFTFRETHGGTYSGDNWVLEREVLASSLSRFTE